MATACCAAVGASDAEHDRCEPVEEAMGDHQGDVMNGERDEGDQPEKVQASSGLTATEETREPGKTASERG